MARIKQFFLFILLPLGGLLATMWAMVTQNQRLKDQIARHKAKEKFEKVKTKMRRAKKDADKAENDFWEAYDDYRAKLESISNTKDGGGGVSGNS